MSRRRMLLSENFMQRRKRTSISVRGLARGARRDVGEAWATIGISMAALHLRNGENWLKIYGMAAASAARIMRHGGLKRPEVCLCAAAVSISAPYGIM